MTNSSSINIKLNESLDIILKRFCTKNCVLKRNFFSVDIYMVNKNTKVYNIKNINELKDYAIINDTNGNRSVTLHQEKDVSAKIYSIFLQVFITRRCFYLVLHKFAVIQCRI